MRKPPSCLLFGYLGSGILLLVVTLAGCGVTSTSGTGLPPVRGSSSSTPAGRPSNTPQLSCVLTTTVHPIDSMSEGLHCTVAHVAASETAFVLQLTATGNAGPHTFFPACQGALSGGSGSCSVGFSAVAPFAVDKGTVAGSTLPSHYPLGPVVPTQVAGTPSEPLLPLITPTPLPATKG
jgi:hypothetical protein